MQARQARFELLQSIRIQFEIVAQSIEPERRLVELDLRAFDQGVDLGKARFVFDHALQFAAHRTQGGDDRDAFVRSQPGVGAIAAFDQAGGMRLAPMRYSSASISAVSSASRASSAC